MFEAIACVALIIGTMSGVFWISEEISKYFEEEQNGMAHTTE